MDSLNSQFDNFHLKYAFTQEQIEEAITGRVNAEKVKEYINNLQNEIRESDVIPSKETAMDETITGNILKAVGFFVDKGAN